ncbi:YciK family oxidoreductase [Amphritea sp. 1_MG-2023]|uniref:YciK family oxidoreductase n=1 Tax=Amphritea sp. 1_MG-2023 TaxID=3062670 RepID=UPI0026E15F0D|nr:YciK family oxidoreductase [Amphritea sp. 1_MG-2023]MDO6562775.1 YciK family oxidoreductase [Amphritea sp. 1_MG-2023]
MYDYQAAENLLQDKIILVTGAGDGIGRAAALSFAAHGATVILLGRTEAKLNQVYDEIEAAGYPQAAIIPLNLEMATDTDFDRLAALLEEEFGRLDGILHNASLLGLRTPIESYDPITWQQVMQVNVNSTFMLTQALLSLTNASADASIIFTSSGVGRTGKAFWGAYAVSKFATEGLMQVLADELDHNPNIRVNAINPGATRTNMRASAYPAENPESNPTPEEIMPAYLYLMGRDSRGTTGKSIDAQ